MKGIYLASCIARHSNYDIVYQDIDQKYHPDIGGSMLDIDLSLYDYIIATPPCNWWSKLNMKYYLSTYAWETLSLLPLILIKLVKLNKPFIVENVINRKRFTNSGIYQLAANLNIRVVEVGRHTYFTNTNFDLVVPQHQDFKNINGNPVLINNDGYSQGGSNVHAVIEKWLYQLHFNYYYNLRLQ